MRIAVEMAWVSLYIGRSTTVTTAPMDSRRSRASRTDWETSGSRGASKYSLGIPMRRPRTSLVRADV